MKLRAINRDQHNNTLVYRDVVTPKDLKGDILTSKIMEKLRFQGNKFSENRSK
jgi:hypothetical protein